MEPVLTEEAIRKLVARSSRLDLRASEPPPTDDPQHNQDRARARNRNHLGCSSESESL
jgi:hypothetical protein